MARFLITTWPFAGHTNVNMAIALALKAKGHDVGVYTGRNAVEMFAREGLRSFPFVRIQEDELNRLLMDEHAARASFLSARRRGDALRGWLLDTIPDQVADLTEVLDHWAPDAVVSDVTMWGIPLVLRETRSLPVAVSLFMPGCLIPGPGAPPYGLGLPRPDSLPKKLLCWSSWRALRWLSRGFRRRADEVRARYGLPPLDGDVHEFLGRMDLYLVPGTPEFDYARTDLPSSVHYVGGLGWNRHASDAPPPWLVERKSELPLVHVTEGTMHAGSSLVLKAAAEGLGGRSMEVIMTSGKDRDPRQLERELGPLASNIRIERFVPHSDLLPRTAVMVTTGGGSSVVAGLQSGVPMVVVPTQWEKPDNAQRVVEAGVGIRIAPRRCTPLSLRRAIEQILADDKYRVKARKISLDCRRLGNSNRVAILIEGLIRGPATLPESSTNEEVEAVRFAYQKD